MELVTHYSNTPDLLTDLRYTLQAVTVPSDEDDEPGLPPQPASRAWRLHDRLSEEDTETIIKEFKAGTAKRVLAERYGISVCGVRTILRQHGVKRRSKYDTPP